MPEKIESRDESYEGLPEEKTIKEQVEEILKNGEDLSKIIPGAPSKIEPEDPKNLPKFLYKDTSKVVDVLRYSGYEGEKGEKLKQALQRMIKDKIVVDLGAGNYGEGFDLAEEFGCSGYVGVEPEYAEGLKKRIRRHIERLLENKYVDKEYIKGLKVNISKTDMRKFLSELPDNCKDLTVLVGGIDAYILGFSEFQYDKEVAKKGKEYRGEIDGQIKRVLSGGGGLISYSSCIALWNQKGYKNVLYQELPDGSLLISEKEIATSPEQSEPIIEKTKLSEEIETKENSNLEEYIAMQDDPEFRQRVIERVDELMSDPNNSVRDDWGGKNWKEGYGEILEGIKNNIVFKPEDLQLLETKSYRRINGQLIDVPKLYFEPNQTWIDNPVIAVGYSGEASSEDVNRHLMEIISKAFNKNVELGSFRQRSDESSNYDTSMQVVDGDKKLYISIGEIEGDNPLEEVLKMKKCPADISDINWKFEVNVGVNVIRDWKYWKPVIQALAKEGFSLALYGQGADVQCYHIVK